VIRRILAHLERRGVDVVQAAEFDLEQGGGTGVESASRA
jgi:hypothetical protein